MFWVPRAERGTWGCEVTGLCCSRASLPAVGNNWANERERETHGEKKCKKQADGDDDDEEEVEEEEEWRRCGVQHPRVRERFWAAGSCSSARRAGCVETWRRRTRARWENREQRTPVKKCPSDHLFNQQQRVLNSLSTRTNVFKTKLNIFTYTFYFLQEHATCRCLRQNDYNVVIIILKNI